jgi:hypothetical protein
MIVYQPNEQNAASNGHKLADILGYWLDFHDLIFDRFLPSLSTLRQLHRMSAISCNDNKIKDRHPGVSRPYWTSHRDQRESAARPRLG